VRRQRQSRSCRAILAGALALVLASAACDGTLDAGRDVPRGPLPVDARNPVIIDSDGWSDNWMGEYAALLANSGGPPLVGIIANATRYWPNATANAIGWMDLVTAARDSGLHDLPGVTISGTNLTDSRGATHESHSHLWKKSSARPVRYLVVW